ncbi:DUF222 domain-containing protein [Janibacter sp. G56]|uniref:HNH endonuclease signature motif containing protein n=1 Tax=Janibacter sp. G56 TaxID=3418717 RepID=UPI003D015769
MDTSSGEGSTVAISTGWLDGAGAIVASSRATRVHAAVEELLKATREEVWQQSDHDVAATLGLVGIARHALDVLEVGQTREALERGLPAAAGAGAVDWVVAAQGAAAPAPDAFHAAKVVHVASAGLRATPTHDVVDPFALDADGTSQSRTAGTDSPASAGGTSDRGDEEPKAGPIEVCRAFAEGDLSLGKAAQLIRFEGRVRPTADRDQLAADLAILLDAASDTTLPDETGDGAQAREGARAVDGASADHGRPTGGETRIGGLTDRQLATAITVTARMLTPARDLDTQDRVGHASRSVTRSRGACGMALYRLEVPAEDAATLEAMFSTYAAPTPGPDGERDPRTAPQRRADALMETVRRGVQAPGPGRPGSARSQIVVTIPLATLAGELAGAGLTDTGDVLPPDVIRRMACDAEFIPMVLGGRGEVLDVGQAARLFTPGQRRALIRRDAGCTFPGCTIPPAWTQAHHVDWWSHGGPTDLSNAALLCQRHHTHVHKHHLTATVTAAGVTWEGHLRPPGTVPRPRGSAPPPAAPPAPDRPSG